jgi:hemerythrin
MKEKYFWDDKLSVNVKEIDEQHKNFLKICNELFEFSGADEIDQEEFFKKTSELGDYALYHLSTEEELFEKTEYPEAANHKNIHDIFRTKIKEYINQVRDESLDKKELAATIADFSGNWLVNHIAGMDKQYTEHFNKNGVE